MKRTRRSLTPDTGPKPTTEAQSIRASIAVLQGFIDNTRQQADRQIAHWAETIARQQRDLAEIERR